MTASLARPVPQGSFRNTGPGEGAVTCGGTTRAKMDWASGAGRKPRRNQSSLVLAAELQGRSSRVAAAAPAWPRPSPLCIPSPPWPPPSPTSAGESTDAGSEAGADPDGEESDHRQLQRSISSHPPTDPEQRFVNPQCPSKSLRPHQRKPRGGRASLRNTGPGERASGLTQVSAARKIGRLVGCFVCCG